MPKDLYCDKCDSPDNASEDYDGLILCGYHRAEYDLKYMRAREKDKLALLKSVWLELATIQKEIADLESRLKQYEDSGRKPQRS